MVRNDLLHAVASIDWAVFNLPSFETKIDAWLRDNVYADVIDVQGNTADQMVVAVEKELLPLSFVVAPEEALHLRRRNVAPARPVMLQRADIWTIFAVSASGPSG